MVAQAVLEKIEAVETVTQSALRHIERRRKRIAGAEKVLKRFKADLELQENSIIKALQAGAEIEEGKLTAELRSGERKSVSWQSIVKRLKGEGYIKKVLAATKGKVYWDLLINESVQIKAKE